MLPMLTSLVAYMIQFAIVAENFGLIVGFEYFQRAVFVLQCD